ncbi:MAG: pseudouridine synthase [Chloroflexota bacterium]|nr:rRNA pseudouridine synthase [Anaerolineae bacterium]
MDRLSKVLANRGIASRRRCEELIEAGRVRVNGQVVMKQGVRVDPEKDRITVDGRFVREVHSVYVLLNKPVGYVSTAKDPQGRPTVLDLVPIDQRIYPVGRLDMSSEGLLLMTNDGAIADRLTHPRYEHEREYWALVEGRDLGEAISRLRKGVELEDGSAQATSSSILPDQVVRRQLLRGGTQNEGTSGRWLRIVIREGRKRQIRRMCEAVGNPVARLIRVRMGPLHLGDLAPGAWRYLTDDEVESLYKAVGMH